MSQLAQQHIEPSNFAHAFAAEQFEDAKKMAPHEVRQTVAALVAEDKLTLAVGLCEAALAIYPDEQDILSIYALVAELKQDWALSEQLLVRLIELQGADSTELAWLHLVRVLVCQNRKEDAWIAISFAVTKFPQSSSLAEELTVVQKWVESE